MAPTDPDRGHRLLPHTADVIIEAWAPTRAACVEEAVAGLVAVFAEIPQDGANEAGDVLAVAAGPAADETLLVDVLDEVIFRLDVDGTVPFAVELADAGDRLEGRLFVRPLAGLEVVGPGPKAVSRSGLVLQREKGGWRARVTVDV